MCAWKGSISRYRTYAYLWGLGREERWGWREELGLSLGAVLGSVFVLSPTSSRKNLREEASMWAPGFISPSTRACRVGGAKQLTSQQAGSRKRELRRGWR